MDNNAEVDKRQPHMLTPPKFVELRDLENIGVLYHKVVVNYSNRLSASEHK